MRIIAGTYRSRTLAAPPGMSTRPTSDRLRETLFNVLAPRIQGASFLDLYAGSGAVGLEALSRGAASVTYVERAPAALKVLDGNLARLGISDGVRVHRKSVGAYLRGVAGSDPKLKKVRNQKQIRNQKNTKWFFSILRMKRRRSMRLRWDCWVVRLRASSRPERS